MPLDTDCQSCGWYKVWIAGVLQCRNGECDGKIEKTTAQLVFDDEPTMYDAVE